MAHGAYAKRRVAGRYPSLGTSYAARSSRYLGARSKEWDKKAIRNQIRFIERLLKRALPLEIKTAHEKRLEDLKWQAELHLHRKMALRDRKLKFFERRKLERRIRRLEKRYRSNLDQQQNNEDEARATNDQLNRLKEDLEYVRFFPKSERYISLFMGSDDELTNSRRTEIREKIKARRASAAASGHELEETGSEDDGPMDLSDDDMFAEGSSSDDADADDEWTDRPGDDREDTSRETGPCPIAVDEAAPQQRERLHSRRREECARVLMPPPRAMSRPSSSSGVVGVRSRNRLNYVSSSNSEEAVARTSSSGISSEATRFVRQHHVVDGGDDDDRDDDSSSSDSNASFSCKRLEGSSMATEGVYAIKPPRLEDAGLEDTALSPEGIQEAFKIAAQRVKGTATGLLSKIVAKDDETDGKACTAGPLPIYVGLGDALVEGESGSTKEGSCVDTSKGGLLEEGHDEVVDKTGNAEDKLVQGEEAGPKLGQAGCVKGDEETMAVEQREAERKAKAKEKAGRDEDAPGLIEAAI